MGGWLEGNAVAMPDGEVVNILRPTTKLTAQKAAIVHISADGKPSVVRSVERFLLTVPAPASINSQSDSICKRSSIGR